MASLPLSQPEAQSSERLSVMLPAGQSFFYAVSFSLLTIVANALFLAYFGSDALPYVYIAIGFLVSMVFYGYGELQRRLSIANVSLSSVIIFTALFFIAWLSLTLPNTQWIAFGLMIFLILGHQASSVVVGGQVGQLLNVRQIKRLYPIIVAGTVLGSMTGGLLIPLLTNLLGETENLLLAAGGSMLIGLAILLVTIHNFPTKLAHSRKKKTHQPTKSLPQLLRKKYVRLIFFYQMLSTIGTRLVLFIFLDQAEINFPSVEELTQFFGNFMIVLHFLSVLFLMGPSGYLLNRFGLSFGLAANPAVVTGPLLLMVIVGLTSGLNSTAFFAAAIVACILDIVFTAGTTNASVKATYQAMSADERLLVETTVEGIGNPIAFGISGIILLLFNSVSTLTLVHLLSFTILVTIVWIVAALFVYREYGKVLVKTLSRRALGQTELSLDDRSSLHVVEKLLQGELPQVRLALDMLERASHESLDTHLMSLMTHTSAEIRQEALSRIERRNIQQALPLINDCLSGESHPNVKGTALRALSSLKESDAVEEVATYLSDPDPSIRLGATVGLLRYGGIVGAVAAWEYLKTLQDAPDSTQRAFMARAIGEVEIQNFYQPLPGLLADNELAVRQAALMAASQVNHPRLLPAIIDNLLDTRQLSLAMNALVASGERLLPIVAKALADESIYEEEIVIRLVRACGQIQGEQVIEVLRPHINHPDDDVQYQVLLALHHCGYQADPADLSEIEYTLRGEVEHGLRTQLAKEDIGFDAALGLLQHTLDYEFNQARKRVFLLISFIYDSKAIVGAEEKLIRGSKSEKALALETLDVALSSTQKGMVLPLVNPNLNREERIQQLNKLFNLPNLEREERLNEIISDPERFWTYGWTQACAIYANAKLKNDRSAQVIEKALAISEHPIRETAVWALHTLASDIYHHHAADLAADSNPQVAKLVIHLANKKEKTMLLTIEKVAILKSADIFAQAPDHVLASVAAIVEEIDVDAGTTFISQDALEEFMYIVVEGRVRIHQGDKTIRIMETGGVVGEVEVLNPGPRQASATALQDTQLFRIEKDAFDEVMADRPEIAQSVIRMLCQRLNEAML